MEVSISLNPLLRPPGRNRLDGGATYPSLVGSTRTAARKRQRGGCLLAIEAKGKKAMAPRPYQRMTPPPPPLPQFEDDGNPRFVIFIRMASIYLWYPLTVVTGGTSAKLMIAAKENFIGKYIYKDTLNKNLAAVVYRDEKELLKVAMKQYRVLRSATEFRYGYKLVQEKSNWRDVFSTSGIIELPQKHELKTLLGKVKDFFGDAKESFGKLTALNLSSDSTDEDSDENSKEKTM